MRKPQMIAFLWLLRFALLASATLLCLCMTVRAQRTIRIPADTPSIQSAIDIATDGDTLIVAPGTYTEHLNFRGKAITLQSAEGPAVTILDGGGAAPVVTFASHETRATTLSGFTLRNGAPADAHSHSGGILLLSASPTLTGNILTQNTCTAIDATDSSPHLTQNIIRETQTGAVCVEHPNAPAIFIGGAPILDHNLIEQNDLSTAPALSSGVAILDAAATLQGNIIRNNRTANDAPSALLTQGAKPMLLEQNLIYANANRCGAAISLATPGRFLNNTVTGNLSEPTCTRASELSVSAEQILIVNNIIDGSPTHPALDCPVLLQEPWFHHNLLHNAASNCPIPTGNLLADPVFADPAHADYHLSPHSPALDEGTTAIASLPQRDLDNIVRVQNGHIDLGPYEHALPRALNASTTVLYATPTPAEAFQPITLSALITSPNATPTGSVTFTANTQTLATVALDANGRAAFSTSTLPAATYVLTATYNGSDAIATSSSAVSERIAPATTLLSFAVTPSSADQTQTITLSATVKAPLSTQIPSGQVQFLELTTHKVLATVPLDATGHASTALSSMPSGTWLVDAAFLGSPNFAPVTLPTLNALPLNIANHGYVLTAASPTITIQSGHHAPIALTLISVGTFAAGISLSCAGLPANATCAFSPASPSLTAGATIPVTLTLDTDAIPGFLSRSHPAAGPALAFLVFFSFRRRRRAFSALCLVVSLTGCSSQYPAQVASGTYTIQVISQATGSYSSQTILLTLVVTN